MAKALYLVYSNCEPGREEEFNQWYDTVHLPDLLRVEGIVGAQRFRLAGPGPQIVTRGGDQVVANYLAVYELDTDDIDAVLKRIGEARGQWQMFDGLQVVTAAGYAALGERQTAKSSPAAAATS